MDGKTGVFFGEQTEAALIDAAARAGKTEWDAAAIRAHAERFGEAHFLAGLRAEIARLMEGPGR